MKKLTNYALGARGIRTKDGVVYLDPGETREFDPKTIVGDLPDLGKKSDAAAAGADGEVEALTAQVDDLTTQVADLTKQVEALESDKAEMTELAEESAKEVDALQKANADLTKQVEALKKPAGK